MSYAMFETLLSTCRSSIIHPNYRICVEKIRRRHPFDLHYVNCFELSPQRISYWNSQLLLSSALHLQNLNKMANYSMHPQRGTRSFDQIYERNWVAKVGNVIPLAPVLVAATLFWTVLVVPISVGIRCASYFELGIHLVGYLIPSATNLLIQSFLQRYGDWICVAIIEHGDPPTPNNIHHNITSPLVHPWFFLIVWRTIDDLGTGRNIHGRRRFASLQYDGSWRSGGYRYWRTRQRRQSKR